MLEIYSNPTLGMSCFQSDAIDKRVIQLSLVSICSMMCPHSYPDIFGCTQDSAIKFHIRINTIHEKFHLTEKYINNDNSPAQHERNNFLQLTLLVLTGRNYSMSRQAVKEKTTFAIEKLCQNSKSVKMN